MKRIVSPKGQSWCYACQQHLSVKFFGKDKRRWDKLSQMCKPCATKHAKKFYETKIRKYRENKIKAVLYLGNRCKICGKKNLPIACFTFHHTDPDEKEFALGELLSRRNWISVICFALIVIKFCITVLSRP